MKKIHLCYFIPLAACTAIVFLNGGATGVFHMFLFLLFFIGLIGSASAGFNGRTSIAVISGVSLLISIAALEYFGLIRPNAAIVDGWGQASFIAGCVVLAVAFLTHNNKTLAKLQVFYYVPGGVFLLFSIFSLSPAIAKTTLVLLLVAWITVKGLNSMCSSTPIDEKEEKALKRKLKIALSIFVFSIAWLYSDIIFAVARHTYRDFTSTWTAPEPLGLENWIDHAADGFAGGTGTSEDPFLVSKPEQLAYLAKRVNTGTLGRIYVNITGDIDLAGREWAPIGTRQHPFSGRVNGGDSVIYNLTIATSQNRQGLFGVVVGVLENLTLVGVDIRGRDFVGGLAGVIRGAIRNSSLIGVVEGRHFIGGLSGYGFFHHMESSYFVGNVKGDIYVGGLIGKHTINEGDRFVAFAYASMPPPAARMVRNIAIGTVSGRKYVGGLIGHGGERTVVRANFFAGKVRGEAFSAGISGFFPLRARISWLSNFAFLYEINDRGDFAEIAHGAVDRLLTAVLRHVNGEWYFNSNSLSQEDAEARFFDVLDEFGLTEAATRRFGENILERLRHPFYVLNIPYGAEIPQNAPISIEIGGKGFNSSLESFLGGRFWVEDNYFKMSGSIRDIPRGVYAIPCSRDVDGRFETIWVLLNVI